MKHGEVIIYQSADGTSHLDVRLESDTVWLTQDRWQNYLIAMLKQLVSISTTQDLTTHVSRLPHGGLGTECQCIN